MRMQPHLLPYERWLAKALLRRQQIHQTPAIKRMEDNYGVAGITLWAAAFAAGFPGAVLAVASIVLDVAGDGGGTLSVVSGWLFAIAVVLICGSLLRAAQGARAGQRFRAGRPFRRR
jgi:hypothetical protein